MTPEEKVKELMTSLGAVAETLKVFYDDLIDEGFNEVQAMSLTLKLLEKCLTK